MGLASSLDPIPKIRRKWEYFESARRRFGSVWLISLKLRCILRQLRQSGPNQLYFDFIPAKKMAALLVVLHHLRVPSVSLPLPRIFSHRPSTQTLVYHLSLLSNCDPYGRLQRTSTRTEPIPPRPWPSIDPIPIRATSRCRAVCRRPTMTTARRILPL